MKWIPASKHQGRLEEVREEGIWGMGFPYVFQLTMPLCPRVQGKLCLLGQGHCSSSSKLRLQGYANSRSFMCRDSHGVRLYNNNSRYSDFCRPHTLPSSHSWAYGFILMGTNWNILPIIHAIFLIKGICPRNARCIMLDTVAFKIKWWCTRFVQKIIILRNQYPFSAHMCSQMNGKFTQVGTWGELCLKRCSGWHAS